MIKAIKNIVTAMLLLSSVGITSIAFAAEAAPVVAPLNPAQVEQVQKIIHDYLLQNPQLVVEVIHELQTQQQVNLQKQAIEAIHKNAKALFDASASPVIGNPKAAVTLVEFFDYQCPHCKSMTSVIENLVKQNKDLKVIFKEFPIFPGSMYAAQAALAANIQGNYWAFHNALMADRNPLSKQDVIAAATKLGLDMNKLEKEISGDAIKNELQQNQMLAEKIGLQGTPAFIVQSNRDKAKTFFIPGQVDQNVLQKLIDKAKL